MSDAFGGSIDQCCGVLKLDFSSRELAQISAENGFSQATLNGIGLLFEYLRNKKEQTTIQTILRMSRLPQKVPKTFENFDFSVLRGKGHIDLEKLENIRTLAPVYAHRNLAFIGPAGTGKTHLAQAFGYECCKHGLWRENFNEEDSLLCALDRIFDDATVFNIHGESFRGKHLETYAFQAGKTPLTGP